ncbi:hypothetical protein [Conexibacter arvalis]|uniref:Uncharacterized protein n=1 Tax=Conexibacter arvalis TaxID=912552 RepID=A0A840IEB1_9ACTN|nr:hypothetical protein [Conexibacter arvalis]MBB4663169.1 hypothetical protein [Conexibacter arvalis]
MLPPVYSAIEVRDVLLPVLTFAGGLIGVLVAGRMNRNTLTALQSRQAAEERALHEARREEEARGERRMALGAAKVLSEELRRSALLLELMRTEAGDPGNRAERHAEELPLRIRAEDLALLARHMTDDAWLKLAEARARLDQERWDYEYSDFLNMNDTLGAIEDAQGALLDELIPSLSE